MQVRPNIPSRFKPKPYAWHAAAVSALIGTQVASDNLMLPRLYKVGPVQPFDHLGNMPISAILALGSTYSALGLSSKLGINGYQQDSKGRNIPTRITKTAGTAIGAAVGIAANSIVETKFGLTQLEKITDIYTNEMGVYGGQKLDLIAGIIASTTAGRVAASTFPTLSQSR